MCQTDHHAPTHELEQLDVLVWRVIKVDCSQCIHTSVAVVAYAIHIGLGACHIAAYVCWVPLNRPELASKWAVYTYRVVSSKLL